MSGVKSSDLLAVVDFLYSGEANIYQENLEPFLTIAKELQLKGLMGKPEKDGLQSLHSGFPKTNHYMKESSTLHLKEEDFQAPKSIPIASREIHTTLALPSQHSGEYKELFEESDQMMEKSDRRMPNGKPMYICKLCGKESEKGNVRKHIESKHMQDINIPCKFCEKTFKSRASLFEHKYRYHRNEKC